MRSFTFTFTTQNAYAAGYRAGFLGTPKPAGAPVYFNSPEIKAARAALAFCTKAVDRANARTGKISPALRKREHAVRTYFCEVSASYLEGYYVARPPGTH